MGWGGHMWQTHVHAFFHVGLCHLHTFRQTMSWTSSIFVQCWFWWAFILSKGEIVAAMCAKVKLLRRMSNTWDVNQRPDKKDVAASVFVRWICANMFQDVGQCFCWDLHWPAMFLFKTLLEEFQSHVVGAALSSRLVACEVAIPLLPTYPLRKLPEFKFWNLWYVCCSVHCDLFWLFVISQLARFCLLELLPTWGFLLQWLPMHCEMTKFCRQRCLIRCEATNLVLWDLRINSIYVQDNHGS